MSSIETVPVAGRARATGSPQIRRLLREPSAVIGATIILFFVVLAVFAAWIAPYDPNGPDWLAIRAAPSAAHWFGTDDLGRDVLSRVIFGTQASLAAGMVSVTVAVLVGLPFGRHRRLFSAASRRHGDLAPCGRAACLPLSWCWRLRWLDSSVRSLKQLRLLADRSFRSTGFRFCVAGAETAAVGTEDLHCGGPFPRPRPSRHPADLRGAARTRLRPTIVQATLTMAIAVLAEA